MCWGPGQGQEKSKNCRTVSGTIHGIQGSGAGVLPRGCASPAAGCTLPFHGLCDLGKGDLGEWPQETQALHTLELQEKSGWRRLLAPAWVFP